MNSSRSSVRGPIVRPDCSTHQSSFLSSVMKTTGFSVEDASARSCFQTMSAYFSPSWTPFQADRGRHFSVIVDGVSTQDREFPQPGVQAAAGSVERIRGRPTAGGVVLPHGKPDFLRHSQGIDGGFGPGRKTVNARARKRPAASNRFRKIKRQEFKAARLLDNTDAFSVL